ncbi:hypothetical protein ZIOFF_024452 [Zingiber officinale]|uniref:Senescence-associated protein n=1 Tax=Zingiber officinale TaxID=94328 RepID=A0A8J5LG69_ZINOF|nr:hypothetical protein ZIOFF_024452 [Zingiber officinale]
MTVNDMDCTRWSNNQQSLCLQCDSCKAGVLASLKHSWRKVSVINIVMLILLVIIYVIGCAAFRNAKRMHNDGRPHEAAPTPGRPWEAAVGHGRLQEAAIGHGRPREAVVGHG